MGSSRPSGPRRSGRSRPGARPGEHPASRPVPGRPRATAGSRPAPRPRLTRRAVVLVLVLAVLAVSYASSLRAYLQQRQQLSSLSHNIAESRASIARLERERQRWRDPAYVEAQARQRFGWVMPGEVGYQVIGRDGEPLGHTDSLSDPSTLAAARRPAWWQSAWGSVVEAGRPEAPASRPAREIRLPSKKQHR